MNPAKYSFKDTKKIDLGTKVIYKYPTPTKSIDIGIMIVKGRHPEDKNTFILETVCQFIMYIQIGKGIVYVGKEIFNVIKGDVIFIPNNQLFAVEGNLQYITVDVPAFYREQSKEIKINES